LCVPAGHRFAGGVLAADQAQQALIFPALHFVIMRGLLDAGRARLLSLQVSNQSSFDDCGAR
jgi:hypothetical protein